ncbi:MAG: META domain-containing protein [Chloroflexi bacterium]|nr:META domain-containing protein [Chloroflexota bacterium]
MRKRTLLPILLLLLTAVLAACSAGGSAEPETTDESAAPETETSETETENVAPTAASGEIVTMYVGPELVDCTGVAPQKCMQVKENPDDDYTFFYDQIEGFNYEEGFEYELKVEVTKVENPPADASNLKYTLVEEVSKTPAASAEATDAGMPVSDTLENIQWTLVSFAGPEGNMIDVLPDTTITAQFADGQVSGNSGCNNYSGSYELDGSGITFGPTAGNLMACPQEIMEQEAAYLANLSLVTQFNVNEGGQLVLSDADGNPLLIYAETELPSLTGTTWLATGYNNGEGGVVSLIMDTKITAVFHEDGSLSGTAGCNTYNTSYTVDGDNISIPDLIATTMMACSEPVMEQEQDYLAALPQAATYAIQGDKLELRDANGSLLANYAAGPNNLAGTSWDVISYNNGNQAVVSVIIGSKITANFGEDGVLSGNAGCNDYTASYEINGDALTIGPAAATRKLCAEPEGIMEQEAQYLAALETIATFTTDGEQLRTRTAEGSMAVNFQIAGYVDPELKSALENGTYQSEFTQSGTVTLENGAYSQEAAPGSATQT